MTTSQFMIADITTPISLTPLLLVEDPTPFALPFFEHKVSAGFPSPASDYMEGGLDLNQYLVRNPPSSFYVEVGSYSLKYIGIYPGDKILIDRSIEPKHEHIVLALIHNEFTLTRLYRCGGVVELRPENPEFQPIRISHADELVIWGVATGVVRKLKI